MKIRIRPAILIFIGCLALLIIAWVISKNSDQAPSIEPIAIESGQVDSIDEATAETPVQEDEPVTGAKHAKSITLVPDKVADVEQSEREVDLAVQESVKKMLESALTGDTEQAIEVSNLMRICNTDYKEDYIQTQLAHFKNIKSTSEILMQFGNGQEVSFKDFESIESYLWNMHDKCRAVGNLFEDDLRERIKLLADNGMVTARYLFALWPPKQTGVISEDTLKSLEYQNDALDYTWRNVDEHEALGVLAFAQSYSIVMGLFTPSNRLQGIYFLIAANKCGLSSPWLEAEIKSKLERMMLLGNAANLEFVETNANEIKKLFCD